MNVFVRLTLFFCVGTGCTHQPIQNLIEQHVVQHKQCRKKAQDIMDAQASVTQQLDHIERSMNQHNEVLKDLQIKIQKAVQVKSLKDPNVRILGLKEIAVLTDHVGGEIVGRHRLGLVVQFDDIKTLIGYHPREHLLFAQARFSHPQNYKMVNEWNRVKVFSRAYVDHAQEVVLESDINFGAGVYIQSLQVWFLTLKHSIHDFRQLLNQTAQMKTSTHHFSL